MLFNAVNMKNRILKHIVTASVFAMLPCTVEAAEQPLATPVPIEPGSDLLSQDDELVANAITIANLVKRAGYPCGTISNAAPALLYPGYVVLRCDHKAYTYYVSPLGRVRIPQRDPLLGIETLTD